ncbi:MAG: hypothetical protein M3P94_03970, partial [Chloroflexota bacterium]|nr:hypothetical protein [Chloroflexota bacterium]
MFKGQYLVAGCSGITARRIFRWLHFELEQLFQVGLGPLDPAGEDGFAPEKWPDEQVWIGNHPTQPGQFTQSPINLGQEMHEFDAEGKGRWQRIGSVRPMARERPDHLARGGISHRLFRQGRSLR